MNQYIEEFKQLLNKIFESYTGKPTPVTKEHIELVKKESIQLLHKLYKDDYVSNNFIFGEWYRFNGKFWQKEHSSHIIRNFLNIISTIISTNQYHSGEDYSPYADKKEHFLRTTLFVDFCHEIIFNEDETESFLEDVLKKCNELFYDKTFIVLKLNKNRNLIGFENGVYDCSKKKLREHRLVDYLSFSTHTNYVSDYKYLDLLEPNKQEIFYNLNNDNEIDSIKNALGDYFEELDINNTGFIIGNSWDDNIFGKKFVLIKNMSNIPLHNLNSHLNNQIKELSGSDHIVYRNITTLGCQQGGVFSGRLCFINAEKYLDMTDQGLLRRYRNSIL